jgi:hypothetical protein
MRLTSVAWLGLFGLLSAGPAFALTISNIDPKAHTVTVTEGGKASKLTIESNKDAEAPCSGGCKVKLENGEEYQLKGNEAVSIEAGAIFIDSSPDADVEDLPNIDPDTVPDKPVEEEEDTGEEDSEEDGEPE